MRKKIALLLFFCFFLASCRGPMTGTETNQSALSGMADIEYCRITADEVEVKDGLGYDFDTLAVLNKDAIIKVLRQVDDRFVVQLDNNQIGSIDVNDATPIVRDGTNDSSQPIDPGRQPQTAEGLPQPQAGDQPPVPEVRERTPEPQPEDQPPVPEREAPVPEAAEERQQPETIAETPRTTGVEGLTAVEEQMINLVNEERQRNNLPTLEVDLELTRVARIKSQDMADHNYFSHYSPTYGSPFEMLDNFGINYLHAGENLAGNPSVEDAHVALMNSSGHRKNILSPDFTHIGIGVKPSNRYGQLFTQMFISKPR
ncbi:uncharacterized protein, YkwD family [Natronincola peptidivorans]|uniref:Uncharacterized protein, YkwD family n=1 Tax=Natronincola peptidivorans TaxID=426128 RepID=A0A1I0ASN2_9FIRM|nr:CAP domain-containing protein [Natronincola peptidivorans]SES96768.1 uncharacterized protein, YkwD family [Natronincola peptidivorans]